MSHNTCLHACLCFDWSSLDTNTLLLADYLPTHGTIMCTTLRIYTHDVSIIDLQLHTHNEKNLDIITCQNKEGVMSNIIPHCYKPNERIVSYFSQM